MDFSLSDEQQAVSELAAQIFEGHATVERVKAVEGSDDRMDRQLWAELARANLLGIALPTDVGGSGLGILELCLLLEQQGRRVAPLPLLPTLVMGALTIAEFGSPAQRSRWLPGVIDGQVILTAALAQSGAGDPARPSVSAAGDGSLRGTAMAVPAGHLADRILVPARVGGERIGVFLVDPRGPGVGLERAVTTNREIHPHVTFEGARGERLGEGGDGRSIIEWMVERANVAIAALQVGVAEEALRQTAEYTSGRKQFGKPLSAFQGVALRAADGYIDVEAMRVTMQQAAWRLSSGLRASQEVEVAKWWAAEAGQRVVHATQHLHGGMGADIEYPIHRYYLWGKQLENQLGGASCHLARIGRQLADAGLTG